MTPPTTPIRREHLTLVRPTDATGALSVPVAREVPAVLVAAIATGMLVAGSAVFLPVALHHGLTGFYLGLAGILASGVTAMATAARLAPSSVRLGSPR